jgi:hypothetical protein
MKKFFLFFFALPFTFTNCGKDSVNVNDIYPTDVNGNLIGNAPNDNQWKHQSFSSEELALFNSLDTANLNGTSMPSITNSSYASPNPFTNMFIVSASIMQPWSGDVVIKYVLVDKNFSVKAKNSLRMSISSSITFAFGPNVGSGNYRLYFTYSAAGHEHFFSSWGNIRKQ